MSLQELIIILSQTHQKVKGGGYSDGLHFDQFNHKISVNKTVIYDKGIVPQILTVGGTEFEITEDMPLIDECDNPYERLETLYKTFKTSVPNPYSNCLKDNFIANKLNDIGLLDMLNAPSRTKARAELESFVLLTEFPWNESNHHYWQSDNDKDLVLFKEWSVIK